MRDWGTYPSGRRGGGTFSPERSRRSVFPAALPTVGMLPALHASRWFWGSFSEACNARGSSTNVAINPDVTCHSIWQWNSQTPED